MMLILGGIAALLAIVVIGKFQKKNEINISINARIF